MQCRWRLSNVFLNRHFFPICIWIFVLPLAAQDIRVGQRLEVLACPSLEHIEKMRADLSELRTLHIDGEQETTNVFISVQAIDHNQRSFQRLFKVEPSSCQDVSLLIEHALQSWLHPDGLPTETHAKPKEATTTAVQSNAELESKNVSGVLSADLSKEAPHTVDETLKFGPELMYSAPHHRLHIGARLILDSQIDEALLPFIEASTQYIRTLERATNHIHMVRLDIGVGFVLKQAPWQPRLSFLTGLLLPISNQLADRRNPAHINVAAEFKITPVERQRFKLGFNTRVDIRQAQYAIDGLENTLSPQFNTGLFLLF